MREESDNFGALIRAALRDEAAQGRLPNDFAQRLLCGVRGGTRSVASAGGTRSVASAGGTRSVASADGTEAVPPVRALPRWGKIAASLAAMASFVTLAAWVGVAVYEGGTRSVASAGGTRSVASASDGTEAVPPAASADPETEMISQQGGNTMIARKMATLVGAAMVTVAVPATELTSEPTFVFLRPETSSFWNTATNNTMTVPIDFPVGATSASLAVSGLGYSREYAGITADEFTFELPAPTSPETENVYDLTLSFDTGVTRTAKLGLIQGLSPDAEGTTRCLAPQTAKVWSKTKGRAVLPIPYGTTSFTVNGVETDTGLDGAQGWYAIGGLTGGKNVSLGLTAGGVSYAASLLGGPNGLMVIFK